MKSWLLILYFIHFQIYLICQSQLDTIEIKKVDSLINISAKFAKKRSIDEAMESNSIAEKLVLEKFGPDSKYYGSVCFNYGLIKEKLSRYTEAEEWYLKSKILREKYLGKEDPGYAFCLNNLGVIYRLLGNYEKSELFLLEAIAIREKVLTQENSEYTASYLNLGNLYTVMGEYEKAEILYLKIKNIRENTFGKENHAYANSVNNLGILYKNIGRYELAEAHYLEANEIYKKLLGKENQDYINSINNLGILYKILGDYEKAEPYFLEAIILRKKLNGDEHSEYASSLNNLANFYYNMGNYEKAEPIYQQAIAIRKKIFGKDNINYATSLNGLACLLRERGEYRKADSLFQETKIIQAKVQGVDHPEYFRLLLNISELNMARSNFELAKNELDEAKIISEKALNNDNYDKVTLLNCLGNYYFKTNNFKESEKYYIEAKLLLEEILDKKNPLYEILLYDLCNLYFNSNKYKEAGSIIYEISQLNKSAIIDGMRHLSENEMNSFVNKFSKRLDLTLTYNLLTRDNEVSKLSLDNSLFYKGLILNSVTKVRQLLKTDSSLAFRFNKLKSFEQSLSREYSKPQFNSRKIEELLEKTNSLEKEIAISFSSYQKNLRNVSWLEVQQKLKPGEVAIEFVHFNYFGNNTKDSIVYAALMLNSKEVHPLFIPLFKNKLVDSIFQLYVNSELVSVNELYSPNKFSISGNSKFSNSFYDFLIKPLEEHLVGINKIYYSPSGLLHRINLSAIPISADKVLRDKYTLVELYSTRQLVENEQPKYISNEALLYGGIYFEVDSTVKIEGEPEFKNIEYNLFYSKESKLRNQIDTSIRGRGFNYLPGTEQEVVAIEKIMKKSKIVVSVKKGYNATEEYINISSSNIGSPRILHFATHGFFFPDPKSLYRSSQFFGDHSEPYFKSSDNPMFRSGLILAGGNASWHRKDIYNGKDDGILTAFEISKMNLSNTELVVLSGCDTGLGEIKNNEGVYGMQRAFKIAGAKYLMMSLWQVPDRETKEFMVSFYKNWLSKRKSIPEAFRMTQKEMRERFINPYAWAGFVLVE